MPRTVNSNANTFVIKTKEIIRNTTELFKMPLLWVTMMMLFINFSIQFGYVLTIYV
jgi:hypothetical protein